MNHVTWRQVRVTSAHPWMMLTMMIMIAMKHSDVVVASIPDVDWLKDELVRLRGPLVR